MIFVTYLHFSKKRSRAKSIQNKNLRNLVLENSNLISETSHNPEKVIFNSSNHELSGDEKSLLCKGLNFSIPPKLLDYADHVLPFKLLFRDINRNEMPNEDKEFIKSRLKILHLLHFGRIINRLIFRNKMTHTSELA